MSGRLRRTFYVTKEVWTSSPDGLSAAIERDLALHIMIRFAL